jgi:hypothetical protein
VGDLNSSDRAGAGSMRGRMFPMLSAVGGGGGSIGRAGGGKRACNGGSNGGRNDPPRGPSPINAVSTARLASSYR